MFNLARNSRIREFVNSLKEKQGTRPQAPRCYRQRCLQGPVRDRWFLSAQTKAPTSQTTRQSRPAMGVLEPPTLSGLALRHFNTPFCRGIYWARGPLLETTRNTLLRDRHTVQKSTYSVRARTWASDGQEEIPKKLTRYAPSSTTDSGNSPPLGHNEGHPASTDKLVPVPFFYRRQALHVVRQQFLRRGHRGSRPQTYSTKETKSLFFSASVKAPVLNLLSPFKSSTGISAPTSLRQEKEGKKETEQRVRQNN